MTDRYLAIDNTSCADLDWAGWELIDMRAVPPRTFAVALLEADAKQVAAALNAHEAAAEAA